MSIAVGGKSANLGEVANAHLPGIDVPGGFTVPFYYYDEFIKENKFDDVLYALLNDQKFVHDPAYRRQKLTEMRERLQQGKVNEQLRAQVVQRAETMFPGQGLFVRSSSNSDDLPNFTAPALYTTPPTTPLAT